MTGHTVACGTYDSRASLVTVATEGRRHGVVLFVRLDETGTGAISSGKRRRVDRFPGPIPEAAKKKERLLTPSTPSADSRARRATPAAGWPPARRGTALPPRRQASADPMH